MKKKSERKLKHKGNVCENFARYFREVFKIVEAIFILIFQGNQNPIEENRTITAHIPSFPLNGSVRLSRSKSLYL